MYRLSCAVTLGLVLFSTARGQTGSQNTKHSGGRSGKPSRTPSSSSSSPLKPYAAACHFEDALAVAEVLPLPPDVAGRTVETMHGSRHIPILRGQRVFFGYPGTYPFAKVNVEQLPAGTYDAEKADLISNFEQILATDDGTRNYSLKPTLNGFEIYGLDRPRLEGGAIGVYLLFDDRSGIATTIYFLDASPDQRKFSTLAEYVDLRNRFLNTYTACAHTPAPAIARAKTSSAGIHAH